MTYAAPLKNRVERRHPGHEKLPPVPAVRRKTTGLVGGTSAKHLGAPPEDMRPREVDRKAVKSKRKAAAKNRRKK